MVNFRCGVVARLCFLLLFSLVANFTWAQSETATVSGQVADPTGLSITAAQVKLVDIDRGTSTSAMTNNSGLYTFPSVRPGRYRMEVAAVGFRVVNFTGLTVNVQDHLEQNFKLVVGSVSESITVDGQASPVDTESATVSTIVDRNFAENLPMNGRSFQTLIQLTPGVVLTTSNFADNGQFSVNGQRGSSNYWMVDGVSANIGIGVNRDTFPGNGLAGSVGSFSALGGTNSLVSVDALQEFRIQTSTYAPEFGRTPGGQISIVTRSGTNQFHGTAFDYLRNDVFDANDWFADYAGLPKPKERQNDFGGTFSGPILKDRTFFFFSYEGLRLRLPQVALTTVPDLAARQNAVPPMQPFLNAYPLPNGSDNVATGTAQFNSSYSNAATLDADSLRIDHKLNDKLTLLGRYNYSPSDLVQRGADPNAASVVSRPRITTQTSTLGATWAISPAASNDLRFNYSRTNANSHYTMDDFGGAVPLVSPPFPSPFTPQNGQFFLEMFTLQTGPALNIGQIEQNLQRQFNVVDSLSLQKGSHTLKCGVDFRRLSPVVDPQTYLQDAFFTTVAAAQNGKLDFGVAASNAKATLLFRNLGVYAQDTWRVLSRFTVTYGLRWDVDFVPKSLGGPNFPGVTGFNLTDLSNLALAPAGTPPYKTKYDNVAPRIGVALQLSQNQNWSTVLRGGFGAFYDLATSEVGNLVAGAYPFGAISRVFGGTFPLSPASAAPPAITVANLASPYAVLSAFDPNLQLPYALQWNVALEQSLGRQQTISASYIGAAGKRLLQTGQIFSPNPSFGIVQLLTNEGSSDYNALQLQLQRRLLHGLQALVSETWSHSIDTGSAGSLAVLSNEFFPGAASANRGPSDFDIRNAFSAGLTYDMPAPKINRLTNAILGGWSIRDVIQARSAPPVDVSDENFVQFNNGFSGDIRPDLVPGQNVYLYGPQYPGGKAFNPAAFTDPPSDPVTGNPLRNGNLGRNALRGFGAWQWDLAIHREFPIHESLKLQFRAEMFNALNHPNFGPPSGCFGLYCANPFGLSYQMLGQSLAGADSLGSGGFSPLYQIGGPRSVQFALKLTF